MENKKEKRSEIIRRGGGMKATSRQISISIRNQVFFCPFPSFGVSHMFFSLIPHLRASLRQRCYPISIICSQRATALVQCSMFSEEQGVGPEEGSGGGVQADV